jgi:hypothetical protein
MIQGHVLGLKNILRIKKKTPEKSLGWLLNFYIVHDLEGYPVMYKIIHSSHIGLFVLQLETDIYAMRKGTEEEHRIWQEHITGLYILYHWTIYIASWETDVKLSV